MQTNEIKKFQKMRKKKFVNLFYLFSENKIRLKIGIFNSRFSFLFVNFLYDLRS
jgi:hypothetical protein